ncbi:MAG: efflux RND transporter periplasmic adaptor subunit [Gammaproteobacteria bacterium]|nr:efflux RND transporter periplasmic adaptor subunit [Gammaproteobacteria bacterium]
MTSTGRSNKVAQFYIFITIIVIGVIITTLLVLYKPTAKRKVVDERPPEVSFITARPTVFRIPVQSQGMVEAKTKIKLVAEVAGKVSEVFSLQNSGGFFKQGELLLQIDARDYELAIVKAKAQVAAAQQLLARAEAEAEQARFDLKKIGRSESNARAYALREPHLKEARANLEAAQADLSIVELQKKRTAIQAPFDGRAISKQVDVGQYVAPGSVLAEIYSIDAVEIRLPLSQSQLSLIDVPLEYENESLEKPDIKVLLTANFAGETWSWEGVLLRTEGLIDASNQMLYGVVEVDRPYQRSIKYPQRPPLTPGLFVKARIEGKQFSKIYILPRSALRYGRELWLLDDEERLQKRKINVLHKDEQYIYVMQDLNPAEKVIVSALDIAVQGMQLQPSSEETIKLNEIIHE